MKKQNKYPNQIQYTFLKTNGFVKVQIIEENKKFNIIYYYKAKGEDVSILETGGYYYNTLEWYNKRHFAEKIYPQYNSYNECLDIIKNKKLSELIKEINTNKFKSLIDIINI